MTAPDSPIDDPIAVQIAALGGQGGGVLAEWLTAAARHDGFAAQSCSIPGVAQRTGATTYYFEMARQPTAPDGSRAAPLFSLFPDEDGVDLWVALEPVEAGRGLERGLITERTVVITARQRIFATQEKTPAGDATVATSEIISALRASARQVIDLDLIDPDLIALAAAGRAPGIPVLPNAVILGAMAGCGVLPLSAEAYRAAITEQGVAVEANLRGFEAGLQRIGRDETTATADADDLGSDGSPWLAAPTALAPQLAKAPARLQPLLGHALARLVDYQDAAYGALYLDRLRPIWTADGSPDHQISAAVARRLALWMTYEDVIRVAQIKIEPQRFARIRHELGLEAEAPLRVTDYLCPGRDEVVSLLPETLARWLPQCWRGGISLRIRPTSPWGYVLFRLLAALRRWRPLTARYGHEHQLISLWLAAIETALTVDARLATETAELAVWARGYGAVRQRGLTRLAKLLENWNNKLKMSATDLLDEVTAALEEAKR